MRNDKPTPTFPISSSLAQLLEHAYPDLAADRDLYELIASDLGSRKLFGGGGMHAMMTGRGAWAKRTTELGDQFLNFITESGG